MYKLAGAKRKGCVNINKSGYAIVSVTNMSVLNFLTTHIKKHNLPVLNRKWERVENKWK